LLFFVGTFSGRLTDAGYFREVILFGSILQLLGIFMASISTQYWQLVLSQGICVGLANGCIFTPGVALVSTYFSTKKSLAIGIAASGSAVGGLIFPVMVQKLLPKIGFGWTMRSLGLVDAVLLLTVNVFARQRVPPRRSGPILDLQSFKDLTYLLYGVGMFFTFWGVYFAFFYLSAFARDNIGFQQAESINVLLVLNGVGIIGRVVFNHLADRHFGPLNLMLVAASASSIIVFCMIAVRDKAGIYVWGVAYGISGAAIQSLFPAVLGSLTTDLRKAGVRMGMIFTIVSFAVLTGPPIAGVLISKGGGSYLYAQIFAASSIMVGCGLMCGARFAKSGWHLKVKM
jgi:predicted MFS family arabinose efflux permease